MDHPSDIRVDVSATREKRSDAVRSYGNKERELINLRATGYIDRCVSVDRNWMHAVLQIYMYLCVIRLFVRFYSVSMRSEDYIHIATEERESARFNRFSK